MATALNVHERRYRAPASDLAALLATLSTKDDRVWPHHAWPRMRLAPGLEVGASGGHGPVRYCVEACDPASEIRFRFTGPRGFDGWHAFQVRALTPTTTLLRHEIRMQPRGWAKASWPLFFRPLHDALIEESFDKVGRELGDPPDKEHTRGWWARALHAAGSRVGRSA